MDNVEQLQESRSLADEVSEYISNVMESFRPSPEYPMQVVADAKKLANEIFAILTNRKFCYLSRKHVERYRGQVVTSVARRVQCGEPLRLFYDIGPGYHATTRPGALPLRFDVGFSELLILAQVKALCARVAEIYPPGARFWFVIDNLCALRTNDVPLKCTESYVAKIRQLIDGIDMAKIVDLVVESEAFDLDEYDEVLNTMPPGELVEEPSPQAIDNVARFLGRPCTPEEAAARIERYSRTGATTDLLVDRLVSDVHMTQRATGATLGFRPFPGGDQRTQAGELVLNRGSKGRLRPILLTTQNVDSYECTRFELTDILPSPIGCVKFASPVGL